MEDWKLPQVESEWDPPSLEQIATKSKIVIKEDENEDPVEQIHQRRRSMEGKSATGIHTIQIESRYFIANPDDENEGEPDAFLKNVGESPHTLLDKQCIAQDVINIWEAISEYIILKLKRGVGTIIPGLGTFTFLVKNVSLPKSKSCKLHLYPKFFISEYVAEMYRLEQASSHHSNVPCNLINLSVISKRINIPRPIIEGAVTEVLQAFARGIVCNKNIEFPFPCIGKLQICNQCVRMRFYLDFYKNLKYNIEAPSVLMQDGKEIEDDVIEGRMTPLVYHIPQPQFRSVFHLREVRSVHEGPLLAPVEYHKGRLIPETLMKEEIIREEFRELLDKSDVISRSPSRTHRRTPRSSHPTPRSPSTVSHMGYGTEWIPSKYSIRSEIEEIVASRRSGESSPHQLSESVVLSALTKLTGTESDVDEAELPYIHNPKPLFLEQKTGIEILDKRLDDPAFFTKELEKYILGKSVKILGAAKALAHLKRYLRLQPYTKYEQPI